MLYIVYLKYDIIHNSYYQLARVLPAQILPVQTQIEPLLEGTPPKRHQRCQLLKGLGQEKELLLNEVEEEDDDDETCV